MATKKKTITREELEKRLAEQIERIKAIQDWCDSVRVTINTYSSELPPPPPPPPPR